MTCDPPSTTWPTSLMSPGRGKTPPPTTGDRNSRSLMTGSLTGASGESGAANMIKCFPRGARTRVERLQPYHRGNDPETRRLWELSELANIDKHRRFQTTVATNILMQHGDEVLGHRITDAKVPFRRLKPDTTIMWFTVPSLPTSVAEPDVNFGLGVEIEFDGRSEGAPIPLELQFEPVPFVLETILEFVRTRVVPEFEPFLTRLF